MDFTLTGISFDHSQDSLLVHTVIDERPHVIYVPVLALASRMAMYDLDNESDAFEAIMREHHHRINETIPETGTHGERSAGLSEITDGSLTIPKEAHSAVAQVVKEHKPRLRSHHAMKLQLEKVRRVPTSSSEQGVKSLWLAETPYKLISKAYDADGIKYTPDAVKVPNLKKVWKDMGGHVLDQKEVTVQGLPSSLQKLRVGIPGEPISTIVRLNSQPTPAHVDESMAVLGCDTATLFVEKSGEIEGFTTIFPDLGIEFDLKSGDALSYGVDVLHGNSPEGKRDEGSYRRLVIVGSRRK